MGEPAHDRHRLQHFGDCLAGMLTDGGFAGEFPSSSQDLRQLASDWAHADVRMLASGVDGEADIRQACAAAGLSPSFVDAVLSGYDGVSKRCAALSADTGFTHDPRLTRRVSDVAAAMLLGGKPVLCPFTGERAWVGQEDGLACLINKLARDYPRLGIIFGGINSGMAIVQPRPDVAGGRAGHRRVHHGGLPRRALP